MPIKTFKNCCIYRQLVVKLINFKKNIIVMKKIFLIIVVLFYFFACRTEAQTYNAVANPEAVVTSNHVKFTVLTPGVIRMEWSENSKFTDQKSMVFVNRNLPVPIFKTNNKGKYVIIKTSLLTLKYLKGSGKFTKDNLNISYKGDKSQNFTWLPGTKNKGNLLGTYHTLDGYNGDTHYGSNKKIPLENGILSKDGWVLIDDSKTPLFDNSDWQWVEPRTEGNHQDWYFFGYGTHYKNALYDFTQIAGKIPIPPKFVFGIWWSRYWPYTDLEFKELNNEFKIHDVPLDVMVIDMDWHIVDRPEWFKNGKRINDQAGQSSGWTGFTWEKAYFPNPSKFLKWTNREHLKTCLNIHPASGIQPHEKIYPAFAKAMNFDTTGHKYIPFDITNKKYTKTYFDLILHPMENKGIDFWWLDWQQWSTTKIKGINPIFYLNYVHFSDMQRENKRPLIYHRWGGLGNHRYQIGFSGDTFITWKSLAYQPYFTITASNVCFGYWSHDIGGHMSNNIENIKDSELFTRWVEWGAFSPVFKTHCTENPLIERRIWAYPLENFLAMLHALKLRYSLIPYIYTAAREAHDNGISILRPMYYEYPKEDNAYKFKGQFQFGDDMIVSPVTHKIGKDSIYTNQLIWLPKGEWIEWQTGTILNGDQVVTLPYLLSEIPIFVKAGAIIPMQPDMNKIDAKPLNPLILNVFPGNSGHTRIYEDQGNNLGYLKGQYSFTNVSFSKNGNKTTIIIDSVEGQFPEMLLKRAYIINLPISYPPQFVKINGQTVNYSELFSDNSWTYNGNTLTTSVKTGILNTKKKLIIEIVFPENDINLLSGKKGMFSRLMFVKREYLQDIGISHDLTPPNQAKHFMLYDMARMAQPGLRITYNPTVKQILKEISYLHDELPLMYQAIGYKSKFNPKCKPLYNFMKILTNENKP